MVLMLRNKSASGEKYGCNDTQNDNRDVYRYTREEMLNMKDASSSRIRPQYLSTEFDNDEGKFEPEKWLEYRWICEGVENRPSTNIKRKEKLKVEVLEGDTNVLSPQRRGFSSGCRATSPGKNEAETERLGATKASWRIGAGFQLKNAGTEYKNSFHKNVGNNESSFVRARQQNGTFPSSAGNWRSGETFKPSYQKESGQNQRGKSTEVNADEKMPEWLNDGPTSMHDMIELRGFDDDNKTKQIAGDFPQRSKRHPVKLAQQSGVSFTSELKENSTDERIDSADWRSSSRIGNSGLDASSIEKSNSFRNQCGDDDVSTNRNVPFELTENNNALASVPLLNGKLPNSDAEFAAIMGILGDVDLDSLKENELNSPVTKEPTGSRLSRFFATTRSENSDVSNANKNEPSQKLAVPSSSSVSNPSQAPAPISVLNKIFSNTCQRPFHSQFLPESTVTPSVQGVLRVEDLERNFQKESMSANPSTISASADGFGNVVTSEQLPSNSRQSYLSQQTIKGNPLGDPHQQAHLMNKLNKFARLQNGITDDVLRTAEDSLALPPKISLAQTHHIPGIPLNSQPSSHSVVPPPFSDVTFHAALLRSQYEKAAALHALAANQRSALVSNTQAVDSTALRHALTNIVGNGAMPQSTHTRPLTTVAPNSVRVTATEVLPNSFMPTSVMRQMTKNNNTSVAVDEKLRHSNMSICSTQYNAIKQNLIPEHVSLPHKLAGDALVGSMASKNAANLMTRLAVQQQYAQVLAAMQNGLSLNNWQSNAQMTASVRAQALAAHAEHQRQYALAMMHGEFNQAQLIRARFLSHQAAAFSSLPNVTVAPHPHHVGTPLVSMQPAVTTAPIPVPQNTQPPPSLAQYKYQNPLEKLLQSAGVPPNRGIQLPNKDLCQGSSSQTATGTGDLPSILSRIPPTANCISVEELEKQFAAN